LDDGKSHDSFNSDSKNDKKIEEEKKEAPQKPKAALNHDQIYQVMKALTAMKLTKEDNSPGEVFPELFIGSIGAAYNQKSL